MLAITPHKDYNLSMDGIKVAVSGCEELFFDAEAAIEEIAFQHYPVTVTAGEDERTFYSFDEAADFVRAVFGVGKD